MTTKTIELGAAYLSLLADMIIDGEAAKYLALCNQAGNQVSA